MNKPRIHRWIWITYCIIFINSARAESTNSVISAENFETIYQHWKESQPMHSSDTNFDGITNYGPKIIPFVIDKIQDPKNNRLTMAIYLLTKKSIKREIRGSQTLEEAYTIWWKNERHKTPDQFHKLSKEAKLLKSKPEEKAKLKDIKGLGIDILPLIVEQVKAGDTYLVPVFEELVRQKFSDPKDIISWWELNHEDWIIPEYQGDSKSILDSAGQTNNLVCSENHLPESKN